MARKGENIYKRKDGRWEGRYRIPNPSGTKALYRSVYGKSYREVREKLFAGKQIVLHKAGKKSQLPDKMTLEEAAGLWLEENRNKWKESTYATYRSITEKHVLPLWGTQSADALLIDPPVSLPGLKEGEQKKDKIPDPKGSGTQHIGFLRQCLNIFYECLLKGDMTYDVT